MLIILEYYEMHRSSNDYINIVFLLFSVTATRTSSFEYVIKMNGRCVPVEYRELRNGTLLLKYKDRSHPCYIEEESERYKVHIGRMQVNIILLVHSKLGSMLFEKGML